MTIFKQRTRQALFQVSCIGQRGPLLKPTKAERKAAKWAGRVLTEQKQHERAWEKIG